MNLNQLPTWTFVAIPVIAASGWLLRQVLKPRPPLDVIHNGCRSEYGPLELRVQATQMANGFRIFPEDPRPEHFGVSDEAILSTLDAAKDLLTRKAGEYLASRKRVPNTGLAGDARDWSINCPDSSRDSRGVKLICR